eukprot:6180327-Pleurochrysis_carterae.AAC.1
MHALRMHDASIGGGHEAQIETVVGLLTIYSLIAATYKSQPAVGLELGQHGLQNGTIVKDHVIVDHHQERGSDGSYQHVAARREAGIHREHDVLCGRMCL